MALKKTERSVQSIPLPEFTGGLTNSQSQDNECQVFDNVDISRNQWTASRAGTTLAHNPGAIDYTPVMGIANYGLGDGALHIVVVKTSGIGYYHKPQQGWQAGDRVSFSTFTLPYSPGTNEPVYFEAMAFKA